MNGINNDDKFKNSALSTTAWSDVYRIIDKQRKYDSGQGRTSLHNSAFYKHAIPPGLNISSQNHPS